MWISDELQGNFAPRSLGVFLFPAHYALCSGSGETYTSQEERNLKRIFKSFGETVKQFCISFTNVWTDCNL